MVVYNSSRLVVSRVKLKVISNLKELCSAVLCCTTDVVSAVGAVVTQ